MKILIVEDDFYIAEQICDYIRKSDLLEATILGPYYSFSQAVSSLESEKPDLALLDIQLGSNEIGGINLAEVLQKLYAVPVIFITGLPDKIGLNNALHIKWAGFLKKPVEEESLIRAVKQAMVIDEHEQKTISVGTREQQEALWFKSKGGALVSVKVSDIALVSTEGHYCTFYTVDGQELPSFNARLQKDIYQKRLCFYNHFYLLGRSFLLNLQAISQIEQNHIRFEHLPFKVPIPKGKQSEIIKLLEVIN